MPRTGSPATRHLAAVSRATAVLDALGTAGRDLGTNELARATGINASTVSRLLATLAAAGYVEHVPSSGRYRLGPRVIQLAQGVLARLDVRQVVRPLLEELVAATGETATLSLPGDHDAITADFVPGSASVISVAQVGRPSISHCTAVGKVMLAYGPRGIDALELPLPRLTDATITDPGKLAKELDGVRTAGYGIAVGEREADLNAVAAPVFDARGLAAIIGLQGPAARLTRTRLRAVAVPVMAASARASATMGAR